MSESTEEKKKSGQGIRDCIYYIVNVLDWMGELCSVSNETSSGSEEVRMLFGAGAFLLECSLHADSFSPHCSPVSVLET